MIKAILRTAKLGLLFLLALYCSALAVTESVSIDSVIGEVAQGKIEAGRRVEVYIRLTHVDDVNYAAVVQSVNAFSLFSPDSASWSRGFFIDTIFNPFPPATLYDTTFYGKWIDPQNLGPWGWRDPSNALYDYVEVSSYSDHDGNPVSPEFFGEGVDTIRYRGEAYPPFMSPPGIFEYDDTAWLLLVDSVSTASVGKTLCIDAIDELAPSDSWRWVTYWDGNYDTVGASWDGPYCFEIVADCCEGIRGNINLDLQDTIDISDLTALVGWMFKSGSAPPCMLEADVDGNSDHDIADVTHLVGYMFKSGPEPAGCP